MRLGPDDRDRVGPGLDALVQAAADEQDAKAKAITVHIAEVQREHAKAQEFFAELAAQTRAPHYGGPAREFTQAILLRAIERGLYTPEKP